MKRGDLVTHSLWWDRSKRVEARVRRLHRDGSVTVEQTFCIDDSGERDFRAGYLGYKLRLDPADLQMAR